MNKIYTCLVALMALSSIGFAGERAGAFSISPFIGAYNYDDHINMYTRPVYGIRFGYDIIANLTPELVFNFGSTELDQMPPATTKSDVMCYNYRLDMLYNFMPGTMWVPFLAVGVGGATRVFAETANDHKNTDLTFNAGGGLKCFLSESFALRGDVRHLFALNGENNTERLLHDWEYTVGVSFLFGGEKQAPVVEKTPEPAPVVTPEPPLAPIPATEPTPKMMKYCVFLNIEFDIDKSDVRPQYRDTIAKVGDFMKKFPQTTAVIEGYTDTVGTDEYNLQLSQRRAESVVKYLEDTFSIDPSRLSAKGYGRTMPVASNATDAGKQENRHIRAVIDCAINVKEIAPPPAMLCMTLNVEFPTNSAEIPSGSYDEVNKVGEYMQMYPTTTAVIEGHTDNVGGDEQNMKLSQLRAESVVNYLVEKFAIDHSRLSAKGYGSTRRIAYNDTPEGRQKNRRINAIIDCVVAK